VSLVWVLKGNYRVGSAQPTPIGSVVEWEAVRPPAGE
jgi:hypothetical protein